MEKWEYKTISIETKGLGEGTPDISNFNMVINQLGNVGWELVSCFTTNQEQGYTRAVIAVLKRKTSNSMTEQSSDIQGRAHGHAERGGRAHEGAPRTFGKSRGYAENRAGHPGKSSTYSEKSYGYKGKSSGFKGKASGYKGKSSGYAEKGAGYKGKSTRNGSRNKGRVQE